MTPRRRVSRCAARAAEPTSLPGNRRPRRSAGPRHSRRSARSPRGGRTRRRYPSPSAHTSGTSDAIGVARCRATIAPSCTPVAPPTMRGSAIARVDRVERVGMDLHVGIDEAEDRRGRDRRAAVSRGADHALGARSRRGSRAPPRSPRCRRSSRCRRRSLRSRRAPPAKRARAASMVSSRRGKQLRFVVGGDDERDRRGNLATTAARARRGPRRRSCG